MEFPDATLPTYSRNDYPVITLDSAQQFPVARVISKSTSLTSARLKKLTVWEKKNYCNYTMNLKLVSRPKRHQMQSSSQRVTLTRDQVFDTIVQTPSHDICWVTNAPSYASFQVLFGKLSLFILKSVCF